MKRQIKITTDPEEIKKHLAKLYDKIDLQILLHEAHINQKNSIVSKQEIDKLNKYNLDNNISGS
jgi:hypothetical protein